MKLIIDIHKMEYETVRKTVEVVGYASRLEKVIADGTPIPEPIVPLIDKFIADAAESEVSDADS